MLVREASVYLTGSAANFVPEMRSEDLPAIIKPGEVTLVHLTLPNRFVERMEGAKGATVSIDFQIYSARGKLFMPRKVVASGEDLPVDVWTPFNLGTSKSSP